MTPFRRLPGRGLQKEIMTSALPFPFSLLDRLLSSLETPRDTNPVHTVVGEHWRGMAEADPHWKENEPVFQTEDDPGIVSFSRKILTCPPAPEDRHLWYEVMPGVWYER